jgi:hypothetical protein
MHSLARFNGFAGKHVQWFEIAATLEYQKFQITMTKVSVFPATALLQTGSSTGFIFHVSFS